LSDSWPSFVHSSKFQIDGFDLEYEWHGPDSSHATTLVFLHGGLGSLAAWGDYPARVAEATRCGAFVYSRVGYGSSDPAPLPRSISFMHDEALLFLPKILTLFQIQNAVLFGHSDGGSIAIIHTGSGTSPTHIRGLVLEAPHVFVEDITINSIAKGVENYDQDLKARLAKYHGNVDNTFGGWSRVWLDPKFRSWNIEEYLPRITVPSLVIQGEDDGFGTLAQVESIKGKSGGRVSTKIFSDCGHRPHRRYPDQTLQASVDFLSM